MAYHSQSQSPWSSSLWLFLCPPVIHTDFMLTAFVISTPLCPASADQQSSTLSQFSFLPSQVFTQTLQPGRWEETPLGVTSPLYACKQHGHNSPSGLSDILSGPHLLLGTVACPIFNPSQSWFELAVSSLPGYMAYKGHVSLVSVPSCSCLSGHQYHWWPLVTELNEHGSVLIFCFWSLLSHPSWEHSLFM